MDCHAEEIFGDFRQYTDQKLHVIPEMGGDSSND